MGAAPAGPQAATPGGAGGFRTRLAPALRRRGLRGRSAAVRFDGSRLSVVADTFGTIDIDVARIDRLRVGFAQTSAGVFHQIVVWAHGVRRPLLVGTADPAEFAGFAALVRGLAQALAANGPASRLETGASKRWTATVMSLLSGLVLAFATIARFAHASDPATLGVPPWIAVAVPATLGTGVAVLGAWFWSRHWPRRVRDAADLERVLPRGV